MKHNILIILSLFISCFSMSAGIAATSNEYTNRSLQKAFIILDTESASVAHEVADLVNSRNSHITLFIPPNILIGNLSEEALDYCRTLEGVKHIATSYINPKKYGLNALGATAARYFNAIDDHSFLLDRGMKGNALEPLIDDGKDHPDIDRDAVQKYIKVLNEAIVNKNEQTSAYMQRYNSEAMMGWIVINIFFVESDGSVDPNVYSWASSDESAVMDSILVAIGWWSTKADQLFGRNMSFVLNTYYPGEPYCQTGYEPILHPSSDEDLWIGDIMAHIFGSHGDYFAQVDAFNYGKRSYFNADWSYTAFICYNPPPASTSFTDGYAAWAYIGGPYTNLLFRSFGWSFDRVFAHESGHIFWACDEYYQAGYGGCTSCSTCNTVRPTYNNGNCTYCNPSSSVPCMMRYNEYDLCSYTHGQIGWYGPNPPEVLSPINGVVLSDNTPQFNWSEVFAATRYHIEIATDAGFSNIIINDSNIFGTSYSPSTSLSNGTYYWRVRAGDRLDNWSDFSNIGIFSIQALPSPAISSMSPRSGLAGTAVTINGSNFGSWEANSKVLFSWNKEAYINSWTDNTIICTVPTQAQSGYVIVLNNQGKSNRIYFNVSSGSVIEVPPNSLYYAIDNAQPGDMVLIHPGYYHSHSLYCAKSDVKIIGDDPGSTIIDGDNADNVIEFNYYADTTTVLLGLTIKNGNNASAGGGAVWCKGGTSPLIDNCIFLNNTTSSSNGLGGAIAVYGGSPIIRNNTFDSNTVERGAAIAVVSGGHPTITYNIFKNNTASIYGGAIYTADDWMIIDHNTFDNNYAPSGSAIYTSTANPSISNDIFFGNYGGYAIESNSVCIDISCSDFWNNSGDRGRYKVPQCTSPIGSNGNIDLDPLFCNQIDYSLNANSPCLDLGGCGIMGAKGSGCGTAPVYITVTAPNGDEVLYCDSTYQITWTDSCNTGIDSVRIEVSTNEGSSYSLIKTIAADSNHYAWTVSEMPSSHCLVMLTAFTHPMNSAVDVSDSTFEIIDPVPPSVTLLSPDCGDTLFQDSLYTIRWQASDNIGINHSRLDLFYSLDGGANYDMIPIEPSSLTDSSYNWITPHDLTSGLKIKVIAYDLSNNAASDSSYCSSTITDSTLTAINDHNPLRNVLYQNYPNPFNPITTIAYSIEGNSDVFLAIYDINGRLIKILVNEGQSAGFYSLPWDGRDKSGNQVSSGIYFLRIRTEYFSSTKKMALLK